MASRTQALSRTLANEGFYSCDPPDPGGETVYGISRRKNPQWAGWALVDRYRQLPGFPGSMAEDAELKADAAEFLLANFWRFDGVADVAVGAKLFDRAVNHSLAGAVREAQSALQRLEAGPIVPDGKWGPDTEAATNAADAGRLLAGLRIEWLVTAGHELAAEPHLLYAWRDWVGRALQ